MPPLDSPSADMSSLASLYVQGVNPDIEELKERRGVEEDIEVVETYVPGLTDAKLFGLLPMVRLPSSCALCSVHLGSCGLPRY